MVESLDAQQAVALQPVLTFLQRHAPFAQMAEDDLQYLARHLKLSFFTAGEEIAGPTQGPADRLFIIKQGRVRGESADAAAEKEGAWELVEGESFPIGALLSRRPVYTVHRAVDDTFVFELERDAFDVLVSRSPEFHDFCTRRLASLLDQALSQVQATSAAAVSEFTPMSAPLRSLVQREPVTCTSDTPIREALEQLHTHHVGSIIIVDDGMRPQGIMTLHDVLSRITLAQRDIEAPVSDVVTRDPIWLSPDAPAHEAALLMARHGFGHLCVVDNGRLVGVVSERDLFSLQRIGIVSLSRSITGADDIDELRERAADIQRLVQQMLAQGASVEQIMRIITTLNDHLTRRVIMLVEAELGKPAVDYTWLAFGSEGRYEQTLVTDQDNGILFQVPQGGSADTARDILVPFARRINEALDHCGFPLCKGNIMASNPECCLTADEWRARFSRWIGGGNPEHLLNATIFFDFRGLYGDAGPVEALRGWVLEQTQKNPRFLRMMAENALRNSPPLGLVRDFVTSGSGDHPDAIDLKVNGLTPFVDGARLLALHHGIAETNTLGRLRACAERKLLPQREVDALVEAYTYIQLLRIRHQEQRRSAGLVGDNYIEPDSLNDLDRRILKEAFRQARKLQSRTALDYQL
jgi:CBS domain-containing protein